MMRRLILTIAATVLLTTLHAAAKADSITLVGRAGTGVTAVVSNYTLVNNQFCFTITNTSVAPHTVGTITSLGFNLPGTNLGTFTLTSASNPNYRLVTNVSANATGLGTTLDFALLTGPNFNGGGSPNNGILPGMSATFCITGNFSGLTAQQVAMDIFARFQNVTPGGSDVAAPGPSAVPEPASMLLLGTGLAGAAASIRRRRKTEPKL